ncbi:Mov34-domain-containing protein [Pholiota conissans]|uniref:Mov34-domain-containing protein n=1 Tax=Pholiota conissans TaxID=109636 RepID=A0A9P6CYN7_9AGAR|nr:Mov34-domain-containing protein [Pholiota conissans]
MSHPAGNTGNGFAVPKNGAARRPSSITELAEKATADLWDDTKDFKYYLRVAEKYRKDGKEHAKKGDLEGAFIQLARAATLVLEKLPAHREYNSMLSANQRQNLALNGQDILDNLAELKVTLVDRYDKWLKKHPDGIDLEQTPNVRTQRIPADDAAYRAQQQRERFQEEERARNEVRVQQRAAAEEAAKWRQQRELNRAQDEAERARRKDAAAAAARKAASSMPPPPDYTFSRPPNAYGSQSTVVIAEPTDNMRQQQQQQEQMRLREEEITRRQAEQKRKQEQEGIARRQKEADEAAQAVRLAPAAYPTPSTSSSSPMFPNYTGGSTAVSTPSSSFYQHAPITYPQVQPPQQYQAVPMIMPLENPSRYDGESTDSESLHSFDIRRMHKPEHRTPSRTVRSPSYPPPVTTTSPVPGAGSIRYPSLMSQHQKTQGYFPSLNSMFMDTGDRHHGPGSILFGSNSGDSKTQYPGLPAPSGPDPAYALANPSNPRSSYPRPQPPIPGSANLPPPTNQLEVGRIPIPSDAVFDPNIPLKCVSLPRECLPRFLAIAKVNTEMNRETCGLLLGKDKGHKYSVTTLLIPKQHATSDTCTMDEEELVLQFTEERSLITLGWIHTHPSQSCFMSSVDLHTHSGFQRMLPESFAVVCAPKSNPNFGIFRLTDPPGLHTILECNVKEAFHPHPDKPIYTDADKGHVQMKDSALEIVDLR